MPGTPEQINEFVETLLNDWELDEFTIDQDYSISQAERDETQRSIQERREAWDQIRP